MSITRFTVANCDAPMCDRQHHMGDTLQPLHDLIDEGWRPDPLTGLTFCSEHKDIEL